MADSMSETPVVNVTGNDTATNGTGKIPATPEGMAIAYASLVIMAILPILFGAFRSVTYHKAQKVKHYCNLYCIQYIYSHIDLNSDGFFIPTFQLLNTTIFISNYSFLVIIRV